MRKPRSRGVIPKTWPAIPRRSSASLIVVVEKALNCSTWGSIRCSSASYRSRDLPFVQEGGDSAHPARPPYPGRGLERLRPDAAPRGRLLRPLSAVTALLLVTQFLVGIAVALFVQIPRHHPGANPPEYFSGSAQSVAWALLGSGLLWLVVH